MGLKYKDFLLKEADQPIASKGEKKSKPPDQKMILSDKFRKVLIEIQNMKQSNISKRLLELESSDRLFDFSYVDIDDEGENITFLQSNRIERLKSEGKPIEYYWTSKMRTPQKTGRFIKQMLSTFSDDSIQKFLKKFKTIVKESGDDVNFELVEGDDIVYWYDQRNYDSENGTLGSSCMSGPEAGRYLNCYRNNPNQCKLLILKCKNDKIRGRALVWKLTKPKDKIFMDRVYVNSDDDEMLFTNYAKKQGWYCKEAQKYGETGTIIPGSVSRVIDLDVVLDNVDFNLYPYVDTLRYFYRDEKLMSSSDRYGNFITLTDTEGYYDEYVSPDEEDPMVWDNYNKQQIPESRATWCRYDAAYIATDDAIRLSTGDYAFPKSPHIVFSDYTKKWYPKEECGFSKPLNTWIWNKYLVDVYHDKDKVSPPDKTHRFELNKTIGKVGDNYYDIDILYAKESKKTVGLDGKVKTDVKYDFK